MSENCEMLEIEKMNSVQNAKETADGASQKITKLEKVSFLFFMIS